MVSSTAKERAERTEKLKKKFPNLSVLPESNFSLRVHTMIRDKVLFVRSAQSVNVDP